MNRTEYNTADTRARVKARRKAKRRRLDSRALFPSLRGPSVMERLRQRLQQQQLPRLHVRRTRSDGETGSRVSPRPRRAAWLWLASGRLLGLLLSAGSLAALYWLFSSPQFVVGTLDVSGATLLGKERIQQLANVDGQRIWFVNTNEIADRIHADPFVEKVSVALALPDKLLVTIVERQPELRWQIGGTQYLVDNRGTVLAPAEGSDPQALVLVENGGARTLNPGDHVDPDALKVARQLALRLPVETSLTPTLIGWDIALGVYVTSPSGQTIVFGQSENFDRKLAILNYLEGDGTAFTFLDLRPETPYYRNEGAPAAPQEEPTAEPNAATSG